MITASIRWLRGMKAGLIRRRAAPFGDPSLRRLRRASSRASMAAGSARHRAQVAGIAVGGIA